MVQPELTPDQLMGYPLVNQLADLALKALDVSWRGTVLAGKWASIGLISLAGANTVDVAVTDANDYRGAPTARQANQSIPCKTSEFSVAVVAGTGLDTSRDAAEFIAPWAAEYGACTYSVEYGKEVKLDQMAEALVVRALEGRADGDKPKIIIMAESAGGIAAIKMAQIIREKYGDSVELAAIVTSSMPTGSKDIREDLTRLLAENSRWLRFGYHSYWLWEAFNAVGRGEDLRDEETRNFVTSAADRVSTKLLFQQLKMINEGLPSNLDEILDENTAIFCMGSANPDNDKVIKITEANQTLQSRTKRPITFVPVDNGHSGIIFNPGPYEGPIKAILAQAAAGTR